MKYILSLLLIALLTGCHLSTGNTAKNISAVGKSCTSLCITASALVQPVQQAQEPVSVISASLLDRSASILTW